LRRLGPRQRGGFSVRHQRLPRRLDELVLARIQLLIRRSPHQVDALHGGEPSTAHPSFRRSCYMDPIYARQEDP
jgi:hypothetical protein